MTIECPSAELLHQFAVGELTGEHETRICSHVDSCSDCQSHLATLNAGSGQFRDLDSGATIQDSNSLKRLLESLKQERADSSAVPRQSRFTDLTPWLNLADPAGGVGRVAEFDLRECVGRGGMGVVFRAFDSRLQRQVALKFMNPGLLANATAAERFLREARAAASINHPNVVTVHGAGQVRELPYLVMEYVAGESLGERLNRGPIASPRLVEIAKQVAEGLAAAHAVGVHHRDIKPENILLVDGTSLVKLTDFGLARTGESTPLTQTGSLLGTPDFIAPEQIDPSLGIVDQRSDLFSLGSVLYAMCTGQPPFSAPNIVATLNGVCTKTPPPVESYAPETPTWLAELIVRLLQKDPAARLQSASQVAEVISRRAVPAPLTPVARDSIDSTIPSVVIAPAPTRRSERHRSTLPWPLLWGVVSFACVLGALFAIVRQTGPASPAIEDDIGETQSPPLGINALQPELAVDDDHAEDQPLVFEVSDVERLVRLLEDGDRNLEIRITTNERFHLPPILIEDRHVTIEAAEGFSPRLSFQRNEFGSGLFIDDGELHLQGMTLESESWFDEGRREESDAFIVMEKATLTAHACRFRSLGENPCFRFAETSAFLVGCEIIAKNSDAIHWQPERSSELNVENSVVISDIQLVFNDQLGGRVRLQHNTLVGATNIAWTLEEMGGPAMIEADNNVFDGWEGLCIIHPVEDVEDLRSWLRWRGHDNLFPSPMLRVINEEGLEEERIDDLQRWRTRFAIEESGSDLEQPSFRLDRAKILERFDTGTLRAADLSLTSDGSRPRRGASIGAPLP